MQLSSSAAHNEHDDRYSLLCGKGEARIEIILFLISCMYVCMYVCMYAKLTLLHLWCSIPYLEHML